MTIKSKTTMDQINITSVQTHGRQILNYALKKTGSLANEFEMNQ